MNQPYPSAINYPQIPPPPRSPNLSPSKSNPRNNPIIDLIETEEKYVEDLRCLLQRVTKSWDRNNPPPRELDSMFQLVDEIYVQNSNFYNHLNNIGLDPQYLTELAEILINWVDQMEPSYTIYCKQFRKGFDEWPEIEENLVLQQTLNRLLRGSEPGRKDYNLLAEANTHIDALIELEKKHAKGSNIDPRPKRREIDQNEIDDDNVDMPLPVPQTVKYTVINPLDSQSDLETPSLPPPIPQAVKYTVIDPENSQGDLEKDLKSPPIVQNLLHPRNYQWTLQEFESMLDVTEAENFEAVEIGVRLFLLTDLLLICRQFTQEEKIHNPLKEFWLLFPPLSGRHLVLEDIDDEDGDLMSLTVLKKDTLILRAERQEIKATWFEAISKVIDFAVQAATPQNNNKNEMVPSLRKVGSNPNFPTPRQPIEMLRKSPSIENLSSTDSGYDNTLMNNQLSPLQPLQNDSMSSLESVNSIGSFVETLYQTPPSEICRWINDEWELFINDKCIVELKMTSIKRPCLVVLLAKNGQMILNSWIHSHTTLFRESKVAVSVSCDIGPDTEYYRFSTPTPADADNLVESITKAKAMTNEVIVPQAPIQSDTGLQVPGGIIYSRSSSLQKNEQASELEQTVTQVMESSCKLFLKNDYGVWTNLGRGNMKLSLETPSHRKRIIIYSTKQKSKTIDAIVWEAGVERINKSSVAITLNNISSNTPIVYMIQFNDEKTSIKAFEIMKGVN
nr:7479_t:CDS:10 [Entrophospora candida]